MKKAFFLVLSFIILVISSACRRSPDVVTVAPEPARVIANYQTGDIIEFGGLRWLVLDVQDGYALIITENVKMIGDGRYNHMGLSVTWANSSVRQYLNTEYLENFNTAERARIRETYIETDNNPWYGTNGGGGIRDRVFFLSLEEVVRYFGDSGQLPYRPDDWIIGWISDDYNSARRARDEDGNAAFWWLRSPGSIARLASGIDPQGVIWMYGTGVSNSLPARPALWLRL